MTLKGSSKMMVDRLKKVGASTRDIKRNYPPLHQIILNILGVSVFNVFPFTLRQQFVCNRVICAGLVIHFIYSITHCITCVVDYLSELGRELVEKQEVVLLVQAVLFKFVTK